MEQKRRGRPPGTGKVKEVEIQLNTTITTEPRKRGRKAVEKPVIVFPENPVEGEVEGTTVEKLKFMAIQVRQMDKQLDMEPYRMDIRMKKHDAIQRMCHLIGDL
jgi:hypothetical protein